MNIIKFFKKIANKNNSENTNFGCQTLDLLSWDLSRVQTHDELIKSTIKPTTLKEVDLSKFNTSHVETLYDYANNHNNIYDPHMFDGFNLSNVKTINYLFNK